MQLRAWCHRLHPPPAAAAAAAILKKSKKRVWLTFIEGVLPLT